MDQISNIQKRLTVLVTTLQFGGAQTLLLNLAICLKQSGWHVNVIYMRPPYDFAQEFDAAGIPVDSLGMVKGVPDPRAIWRLAKLLRQYETRVLHSHLFHANILGRIVRIVQPVPGVISTMHNIKEGGKWRDLIYRLTDSLCDLTTNVSQAAVDRYLSGGAVPTSKIKLVPNCVDTLYFSPNPESRTALRRELDLNGQFCWLAVGYLEEQKDYPNMLQAFAQVVDQFPNSVLLICGTGPLLSELEELATTLNVATKVKFLGIRRDIPKLMNAVDAYVMSSAWEGMPIVLLEASSVGLPVVTTDVGGNREVVKDGQGGFLVPALQPSALAETMIKLMQLNRLQREQMGQFNREEAIAHFSIEAGVKRWENLYGEILARSQPLQI